jgi:hypothetical protein
MPTKSKRDEEKWQKAKSIAKEKGDGDNYALIMGIYKNMDPDYFKKAAIRIASLWLQAKGPLWQQFMDEVYEGGAKQVRNTNRDTQDRYPMVAISTLLKTDRKLRKLVRGQFARWKPQREKQGLPGEAVEDLGELQRGQQLEWGPPNQRARGVVQKARPDRAIVKRNDGQVQHIRPTDLESWQPRVLG